MPSYKLRRPTALRARTALKGTATTSAVSNAQLAGSLSTSTMTSTPLLDQFASVSGTGSSTGTSSGGGGSIGFNPDPDQDLPSPQNSDSAALDALKAKLSNLTALKASLQQQLSAHQQNLAAIPNTPQNAAVRASIIAVIQQLQWQLATVQQQIAEIMEQIEALEGGSSSGSTDKQMEDLA